jgi:hypothetical protein
VKSLPCTSRTFDNVVICFFITIGFFRDGLDRPARGQLETFGQPDVMEKEKNPSLDEAKALIQRLASSDRASLKSWLLATFDVRGHDRRRPELHRDEPRNRG